MTSTHRDWEWDLSWGQRIRRRLSLTFGQAYTHPSGKIELDFEAPAGIKPTDDEEVQEEKLMAYEQRRHRGNVGIGRLVGAAAMGFVAYQLAGRSEVEPLSIAATTAVGLWLLTRA